VLLSNEIREGLRPPFSCDHLVGHTCLAFSPAARKKSKHFAARKWSLPRSSIEICLWIFSAGRREGQNNRILTSDR
jgi:hypothetical protein